MIAIIYSPSKSLTQSSIPKKKWVLIYEPEIPRTIDPNMNYISSKDMKSQIKIFFNSKEEAIFFALQNNIQYILHQNLPLNKRKIAYSDNFHYNRIIPWTH